MINIIVGSNKLEFSFPNNFPTKNKEYFKFILFRIFLNSYLEKKCWKSICLELGNIGLLYESPKLDFLKVIKERRYNGTNLIKERK